MTSADSWLHSDKMPAVAPGPPVTDLFANFQHNWMVIAPAVTLMLGILFGTWFLRRVRGASG